MVLLYIVALSATVQQCFSFANGQLQKMENVTDQIGTSIILPVVGNVSPKGSVFIVLLLIIICVLDVCVNCILVQIFLKSQDVEFDIPICRYYYATITVGKPPKSNTYFLDIDTGSDVTWIQCDAPCKNCFEVIILSF